MLRCLGAVNAPLSAALVSAMADEAEAEVAVVLTQLARVGAVEAVEPGWYAPRAPLPVAELEHARARLVDHLIDEADGGQLREWVVGRARAVVEDVLSWDLSGDAAGRLCELVGRLWEVTAGQPALRDDGSWRRRLAGFGERAGRASGNPVRLGALLERAGRVCAAAGDVVLAESQLVRALEVWQAVHDEGRTDRTLLELVDLFSASGRWARALDAAFVLLDVHRGRGQVLAAARTSAMIGDLMRRAGRPEAALEHWQRADAAFTDHAGVIDPREHADVLVAAGRVRWERGEHRPGQDAWHRALALLVDVDEAAAEQIRRLLRLPPGAALPPA
ncbi:hypothetical protein [Actinokineospora sp. NPDC004072]